MLADSKAPVARAGVGVVVRKGAAKPDISTPEKFKQALLDAKTVAYTNPASGGQSGVYFVKLLAQLGITDEINKKAKFGDGGPIALIVAKAMPRWHAADPRTARAFRCGRFRRPAAGRAAIVQSSDRRHSGEQQRAGGGTGAHQVSRVTGRAGGDKGQRHGARIDSLTSEIRILATTAMKTSIDALMPSIEWATGTTPSSLFGPSARIAKMVADGEANDVAIVTDQAKRI